MERKICTICKIEKKCLEFNKNKTRRDGYNTICRVCSKKRSKKYYQENKKHHKKITRERADRVIKENRQKLFDFYKNNPCIDCGESNPIVLECDHKDGVDKTNIISKLVQNGSSWKTIKKEIDKCDVRCANCHRIRTAKQQGWYQDLII